MSDNRISLRKMLDQLPTEQLDEMLQSELTAEHPDGDAVRRILSVLEEREKDVPVAHTPAMDAAWQEYCRGRGTPKRGGSFLLKAASILLVLGLLLFALPQSAQAESIFDLLARWSDGFVEFLTSDKAPNTADYQFVTNHPGLQQLYDTVTAAGIQGPAVPMWVPETLEMVGCKETITPAKTMIQAALSGAEGQLVFQIDIYDEPIGRKYYKDETIWDSYEKNGVTHTIVRNKDLWVVFWSKENIEYSMTVDCHEDVLYDILGSIYSSVEAD